MTGGAQRTERIDVVQVPRTERASAAYSVVFGRGVLERAAETARRPAASGGARDRVVVLADRDVWRLHSARLTGLTDAPRHEVEGGEACKTWAELERVLEFLAATGCSRRSCLVTFGGGSVTDLGGLAASLWKRGLDVVHVPTTLLAQVDAAIGGKTAVNVSSGKNLVGTFHQPSAVLADAEVLATLPEHELRSGLGEVAKSALVGGERELVRLEARARAAADRDPEALAALAADAARVKADVVAKDPEERGLRRVLNLGHTFGHALEHAAGFGALPHGEAVAAGIGLALAASARASVLEDAELPARYAALARALGIAPDLATLCARYGWRCDVGAVLAGLDHDKKGAVGAPEFVLVRRAGELVPGVPIERARLEELLAP